MAHALPTSGDPAGVDSLKETMHHESSVALENQNSSRWFLLAVVPDGVVADTSSEYEEPEGTMEANEQKGLDISDEEDIFDIVSLVDEKVHQLTQQPKELQPAEPTDRSSVAADLLQAESLETMKRLHDETTFVSERSTLNSESHVRQGSTSSQSRDFIESKNEITQTITERHLSDYMPPVPPPPDPYFDEKKEKKEMFKKEKGKFETQPRPPPQLQSPPLPESVRMSEQVSYGAMSIARSPPMLQPVLVQPMVNPMVNPVVRPFVNPLVQPLRTGAVVFPIFQPYNLSPFMFVR